MNITLAQPRGFCAGVVRAIEIVERTLDKFPHPIYVLHEIVHNRYVVDNLKTRGAIFVESLEEVPTGAVCVFSAHGVATTVVKDAEHRQLQIIDATCPLVTKVHTQAQRYVEMGYELIIIGHAGHPEVEGTRGCITAPVHVLCTVEAAKKIQVQNPDYVAYVTQTTLSTDDTKEVIATLINRFPNIKGPALNDICYATQSRQNAVRELATDIDILLVVGANNSSNSNRLQEVGKHSGVASYLIEDADDLQNEWFTDKPLVGITAGASTPEILIKQVLQKLQQFNITEIKTMPGEVETTTFRIPSILQG
ncbi:4-hydroxy-3-methylbut-2-enyl diphosphate reductase [Candidatus Halobeggiatoa sp. HSG11]|nr:4-hydroxy-3-methylbut-2-enyl diphosphate reductase [Candidatus Halobeggiatoa sp. HSG11]